MDERRLDTGQVLAAGILNKPAIEPEIPDGMECVDAEDNSTFIGTDAVAAALEAGKAVTASNYYGVPEVWPADGRFFGRLLQYRSVTERGEWANAPAAAKWFADMYYGTYR